jgi:CubicO group peptidase (beta-lactamase class C family)
MKIRIRFMGSLLITLLLLVSNSMGQGLPTAKPEDVGLSSKRLARINKNLEEAVKTETLPGAVVIVARHGKVAYFESFGMMDKENNKLMQKDAIFRIASMTKPIVSVAIMMLYEEGHFLLRDRVSKYIPEFKNPQVLVDVNLKDTTFTTEPAKREITIRDLLSHTSGIGYAVFDDKLRPIYQKAGVPDGPDTRNITIGDKMRTLAALPLLFHPGEKWHYGLNFDVLGYLVEVISKQPLDQFLEQRIFKPLKMTDTYFYLPNEKVKRLSALYSLSKDGQLNRFTQEMMAQDSPYSSPNYPYEGARTYFSGGGGLSSTAADYVRFCQMLLNGGELDGVRLLSPKTVDLMTMNHIGDLDAWGGKFGLGFRIVPEGRQADELTSVGVYDWMGYWGTRFWIDPNEDLIAIFMSQAGYNGRKFRVLVYQSIVE